MKNFLFAVKLGVTMVSGVVFGALLGLALFVYVFKPVADLILRGQ